MWKRIVLLWILGVVGLTAAASGKEGGVYYQTTIVFHTIRLEQPDGVYLYLISDDQIDGIPSWSGPGSGDPPLSEGEAIRISREELMLRAPSNRVSWRVAEVRTWKLRSVKYAYTVVWKAPRPDGAGEWTVQVPVPFSGRRLEGHREE